MTETNAAGKQWLGHPRGLSTLFFTEMWERFSYYGMRGILILFLVASVQTGGFGLTDKTAAAIYGLYTGFVYLMALPGGWVADRILGQRGAVFLGGCIIAAGHFSMAIPTVPTFYLGLVLIVIGTGLLKPNVSSMVGDLYPQGSARRDAGFSIFYSGINVGALLGPIVCGWLGERVNWHLGFSAAGVGMVLGLIQYRMGGVYLGSAGLRQKAADGRVTAIDRGAVRRLALGGGIVVAIVAIGIALRMAGVVKLELYDVARGTGYFMLGLAIVYFGSLLLFARLTAAEKKRIFVIFIFFMAAVLFWAGFEQAGSSLNLFTDRMTERHIFGFEIPTSWFQSVNSMFLIAFAPLFGWLWVKLGRSAPSTAAKMGYGLVLLAVGFFILAWGASLAVGSVKVGMQWIIITYLLHTAGELCLSPVGLSSVTKLAPRSLGGQLMGTWFMGTALGNLIAGLAAGGFEGLGTADLFAAVGKVAGVAGLVLLIFARPIRKLVGGAEDSRDELPAANLPAGAREDAVPGT
jgi:POT family proton-dependent oligopeptide transporter